MPELTYSITDLEKLTGLNRRTIHFYTQQKMIPPPDGLGSTAKYGEIHYLNLRLIKHLQQSHLKLSGIKEYLDLKSLAEKRSLLINLESQESGKKLDFENEILSTSSFLSAANPPIEMHLALASVKKNRYSKKPKSPLLSDEIGSISNINQSNWQHVQIADGVELNIREDIYSKIDKTIVRLIEQLIKEALKG